MGEGQTADGVSVRNSGDTGPRSTYLLINADGSINVNSLSSNQVNVVGPVVTTATGSIVSVNNASTLVLAAGATRLNALIQNHGASVLGLSTVNGTTFANSPLKLPQYMSLNTSQFGANFRGAIYGIRAAATEDVGVVSEV